MAQYQNSNVSLSFRERLHYGIGTIGYNASFYWVSAFLQIYYTDTIGVSAGALSALVLAVRMFDAINDPIIGSMADPDEITLGAIPPWLLFGGIGLSLSMIALFSARSSWSPATKVLWMCIWYVVATVMSTCYDMPYSALHGALSSNSRERVRISSVRLACSQVGTQITGILGIPLILYFSNAGGERTERGYMIAVALICLATMPLSLWTAFKTRERVQPPPNQKKIPLRSQMQTLLKNPPIMIISLAMMTFGFIGFGRSSMMIYYCTYVIGDPKTMSLFSFINLVGSLTGNIVVMPALYAKLHNKGHCAAIGHLACAVFCALIFFAVPGSPLFWVLMFCVAASCGTFNSAQYSMLGDAVDYGEYQVGLRCDGFLSSFTSLALKTGGAIGPALGLYLLSAANYVPNVEQTAEVITMMKATISLVPAVFTFITSLLIFIFYKLSESEHEKIRQALQERREKQEKKS